MQGQLGVRVSRSHSRAHEALRRSGLAFLAWPRQGPLASGGTPWSSPRWELTQRARELSSVGAGDQPPVQALRTAILAIKVLPARRICLHHGRYLLAYGPGVSPSGRRGSCLPCDLYLQTYNKRSNPMSRHIQVTFDARDPRALLLR